MILPLLLALPAFAEEPSAPAGAEAPPPAEAPGDDLPIVEMPAILTYVEAPYPEEARQLALEGSVLLLVELDEAGNVVSVEVDGSSGRQDFDDAALAAVRQMTFSPARTEAGPVGVVFEFEYGFTLAPEPPPVDEPPAPLPITLDGAITEMGTRAPVAGATIVVVGTELVATTQEDGTFAVRGVPPGTWTVRVLSPDHVETERVVEVVEGEVTGLDLWVRSTQYRENEAVGLYQREREEVTRRTLSIEEVRRVPGTFGDPIKVVQTLPGAARSPFGTGLLIIRGANPEDSGVYVDGVRLPIIYHLTGTTSVLTPDLVESVDYLPGGFGVQYGRSMGGVVDVKTKTEFEENGKVVWGTDILDSQVYYEGRLGKEKQHGLAFGLRRSYIDAFIPLFTKKTDYRLKPVYWDYSLKYAPKLDGGREFSAFVYGFEDTLQVSTPEDVAQGSDADTQGDIGVSYQSHRLVLRYEQPLSERWRLSLTPSLGYDGSNTRVGETFKLHNDQWVPEIRAEVAYTTPDETVELVPGVDFIGGWWKFDFASPLSFHDLDDPLAERDAVALDGHGTAWAPDLYLKAKLRPFADDPDRLLITPGVRSNLVHLTYAGAITGEGVPPWTAWALDPRLAARARLWDGAFVKGSSGLYHQPPQPYESVGLGSETTLGFERSLSSTVGFEHQLTPAVQWELELYHRAMDRLVVFDDSFAAFGDNTWINAGLGRAYGAELIVRHAPAKRFFGWISYTLSKSERKDAPEEDWYAFDYDQRHILSAQAGYDLPHDIGVSAQVQYVSGNPTTPYDAAVYDVDGDYYNGFPTGKYNEERLPPFFQTSVRVDRLWTFRKWQLETYVDLLNVLHGVNSEFTVYSYDYTEHAQVRGLPFIPNVGLEAKFWL